MKVDVNRIREKEKLDGQFMLFKIIMINNERMIAILGNDTGDFKASISPYNNDLAVGDVIEAKGTIGKGIDISAYNVLEHVSVQDFLPSLSDEMISGYMNELEELSKQHITTKESQCLNDYFFNNEDFIKAFRKGIGGLVQHHNYLGGLVEHTLNVMYLTSIYAQRYTVPHKEWAILGAKLHDIGKIKEYDTSGPFKVTMRGEMEGHIVIGLAMLEEAFRAGGDNYSSDFKARIRGIITQHHGKVEYGSPKAANSPEAFIVNLSDQGDAIMNKIKSIEKNTDPGNWSEYDRRIGTRLLF